MSAHTNELGYFLFSLDLELGFGYYDLDEIRHKKFSAEGSRERQAIFRLIELFEEYEIVGTWATVGHLFYDKCEYCAVCPIREWKGIHSSFDEAYGTSQPLWYGEDVIRRLLSRGKKQEIAFHGYSHRVFDENSMSQEEAQLEIQEWLRASDGEGVVPKAVVFPRNTVGHLATLAQMGFICFRAVPRKPPLIRNGAFGRYVKAVDHILGISQLPMFDISTHSEHGMIRLFSSQCFFDLDRRVEVFLDGLHLHNLRLRRIRDGIRRAAREKKMVHLWAHPCDFRTEKDFVKLRYVLDAAANEIHSGRMRSVGMTEMAQIMLDECSRTPPSRDCG